MKPIEFVRYNELEAQHINRDLQVHTQWTDGQASAEALLARAEALGLGEVAFTEHVRSSSTYFQDFVDSLRPLRAASKVRFYIGCETKAMDARGTLDINRNILNACDIVLGSVHRFPLDDGSFVPAKEFSYEEAVERELALALGMLRNAPIDVLAHPGGMCQRDFGTFPDEAFRTLMKASLERGIAIEINTAYTRDMDRFLKLCEEVNPLISVGSDVHRLEDLGTCRDILRQRGVGCVSP